MTGADQSPGLRRKLELATTVLLAVAAVATAWSSYQAARWRGEQAKASGASVAARVESTRAANVANRQGQIDVALFTNWVDAYIGDQPELERFYRDRFRDEFRPAFDAWVATQPRKNPDAPLSPFAMDEYKLAASDEADALEGQAGAASLKVARNIQRADNYSLAVVLFAMALFFAGMSTRMRNQRSMAVVLGLGYVVFVGTIVWLATLPVTVSV